MKNIEIYCNDCPHLITTYVDGVEVLYCDKYKETTLYYDGVVRLNACIEEEEVEE